MGVVLVELLLIHHLRIIQVMELLMVLILVDFGLEMLLAVQRVVVIKPVKAI